MCEGKDTPLACICPAGGGAVGRSSSGGILLSLAGSVTLPPVTKHMLAKHIRSSGTPWLVKPSRHGARCVGHTLVSEGKHTWKTLAPPSVRQGVEATVEIVEIWVASVTILIAGVVVACAVVTVVVAAAVVVAVLPSTLQVFIAASAVARPHSIPLQQVPTCPCIIMILPGKHSGH